jgi:pSer/pThr/pTyr-binding forkhead associated (FHA) protein
VPDRHLSTLDGAGDDATLPVPLVLAHRRGSRAGTTTTIDHGPVSVGRDPSAGLCFDPRSDFLVSNRHARLMQDGFGQWWIEDVGSTNGTRVNGVPLLEPQRLWPGDVILLGKTGLAEGACEFEVLPSSVSTASGVPTAVHPFRRDPETGAGAAAAPTPAAVVPQIPANSTASDASPPAEREKGMGGILGLHKIKDVIGNFMSRREIQGSLERARSQLQRSAPSAANANQLLGRAAWEVVGVDWERYITAQDCRAHDERVAQYGRERERLAAACDDVRREFEDFHTSWRAEHERLTQEHRSRSDADESARAKLARAESLAREALAPRLRSLEDLTAAAGEFRDTQVPAPSEDVEARLEILVDHAQHVLNEMKRPIEGMEEVLAGRRDARERAAATREALTESSACLQESLSRLRKRESDRDERVNELKTKLEAAGRELQQAEAQRGPSWEALGAEISAAPDSQLVTLPELVEAQRSNAAVRSLRERIADLEAQLDTLR